MTSPSTETVAFRSALDVIRAVEPRVADAIGAELAAQRSSLKLIAPAVGYANTTSLTRVFRERLGISPTEWLAQSKMTEN